MLVDRAPHAPERIVGGGAKTLGGGADLSLVTRFGASPRDFDPSRRVLTGVMKVGDLDAQHNCDRHF